MKLIATLATLAALVGQTEATASTGVTLADYKNTDGYCTDRAVIQVATTDDVADGSAQKIQIKGLSMKGDDLAGMIDNTVTGTFCNNVGTADVWESASVTTADGVHTIALEGAAACADPIKITLKDVCNNGKTAITGDGIELKFLGSNDVVSGTATYVEASDTAARGVTEIGDLVVSTMPTVKATTAEFKATFTSKTTMNGKYLVLNLPKDYTIPSGTKCQYTEADGEELIISAASDAGLASECSETCHFQVQIPTTAVAGKLAGDKTVTFSCAAVKSGAELPTSADDAVSIKLSDHATNTDEVSFAAYAKPLTPSPTAKPTAKPDDSPASVATASGVVVGALGVAALFLA